MLELSGDFTLGEWRPLKVPPYHLQHFIPLVLAIFFVVKARSRLISSQRLSLLLCTVLFDFALRLPI
jgi:hypothetical protein